MDFSLHAAVQERKNYRLFFGMNNGSPVLITGVFFQTEKIPDQRID